MLPSEGWKRGLRAETENGGDGFASFAGKAWDGASAARVGCREERGPASLLAFLSPKWESHKCVWRLMKRTQRHWGGGGNTKPESLRSECVEVTANLSRYVQTRGSYAGSTEPARQCSRLETQVQSLGWEDLLEESMATHSSILRLENTIDRGAFLRINANFLLHFGSFPGWWVCPEEISHCFFDAIWKPRASPALLFYSACSFI